MHTLPVSFALLTYSGYWRPTEWSRNSLKYWLYNLYSIFMVLLLYTFGIWGITSAALISEDINTLLDKLCLFISVVGVSCKVANLFIRRKKIISVVDILLRESCLPKDEEEENIKRSFDEFTRKLTIYCEIVNEASVFFATVAPCVSLVKTKTLPLATWAPFDYSPIIIYALSFLHQSLGLTICANASVAHETLIAGLMIQTCAQLEILCHRVRNLPNLLAETRRDKSSGDFKNRERNVLRNLIQHHLELYEFAVIINDVFNLMMFLQFLVSSLVLCLSVFKLSHTDMFTADFGWNFSYVLCMLMQLYLYCWFGHQVTLKSMEIGDAVYEMDWTTLPADMIKDLMIIMIRSMRPIRMSSGYVVILSVESFMSIIKLSYSSFNLLKDSSSN